MIRINKKYGDLIKVSWIDACERSGWRTVEEALKIPDEIYVQTVGYYLGHTKEFLTLATSIGKSRENDVGGVWHIPRTWIQRIR